MEIVEKAWLPNPMDRLMVPSSTAILIALAAYSIWAVSFYKIFEFQVVSVLLSVGLGAAFSWALWHWGFGKPEFAVVEDGFYIRYRPRRKEVFMPWSELEGVGLCKDHPTIFGKISGGRVKIKARRDAFEVTYEIAHALQENYKGPMTFRHVNGEQILK